MEYDIELGVKFDKQNGNTDRPYLPSAILGEQPQRRVNPDRSWRLNPEILERF